MNLNELIAYYTAKLENPDLTLRSREIAEATQKWLYNVEVLGETVDFHKNRETRLSAEIAVKDMALADKNDECASLYLRLEEIERYHYDEARKRG